MSSTAATAASPTELSERQALTAYFAAKNRDCEVSLSDFKRSASGYSNETRLFTLNLVKAGFETRHPLVARWAPLENRQFEHNDVAFQYHAMNALADTPVPVPRTVLLETDPAILGSRFFIMEQVAGDSTSDYPPGYHGAGFLHDASEKEREQVWWNALKVMADLHGVDWRTPKFRFLPTPEGGKAALQQRIDLMRALLKWSSDERIEPVERAIDHLQTHMPSPSLLTLCWSDARPGNILFRDFQPAAALDWEGLHICAPENDLAYFILVDEVAWRAHGQTRLSGLPTQEETISRYEATTGRKVEDFDYYMLMQGTWLAIMMVINAKIVKAKGIIGFPEDFATNNVSIARLKQLLP
ncbi:phosphotransferase family protein [Paraburkholderia mimosarum]|uniref:phosphotransferase family protein n=1 Tax=Paraburkholderia mimosarum TaxID=312026 RepID=UPI0039C15EA0